MSELTVQGGPVPITPLGTWEGPALNNPALAGDDKTLEGFLADPGLLASAALWLGVTIGSAVLGNASYDAVKSKVVPFLTAWRRRQGKAKLDELKHKVFAELERGKATPDVSPDEMRSRIDRLFDETAT